MITFLFVLALFNAVTTYFLARAITRDFNELDEKGHDLAEHVGVSLGDLDARVEVLEDGRYPDQDLSPLEQHLAKKIFGFDANGSPVDDDIR